MSVLCVFQFEESGHRIVAVIRSRLEFLERELFPIEYVNPENRRARWWTILKAPGPPRDEFVKVVEDEYRKYSKWQSLSLDDIIGDFSDVMFTIYPDLSEGKKGPHKEYDEEILKAIAVDNDVRPKLFKIIGIPDTEKNIAALTAISKRLAMQGSKNKVPGNLTFNFKSRAGNFSEYFF